jgi:hypothetical protein
MRFITTLRVSFSLEAEFHITKEKKNDKFMHQSKELLHALRSRRAKKFDLLQSETCFLYRLAREEAVSLVPKIPKLVCNM